MVQIRSLVRSFARSFQKGLQLGPTDPEIEEAQTDQTLTLTPPNRNKATASREYEHLHSLSRNGGGNQESLIRKGVKNIDNESFKSTCSFLLRIRLFLALLVDRDKLYVGQPRHE